MWLRMVHKYPKYSPDMIPNVTGRSWDEWFTILQSNLPGHLGIIPITDYLQTNYRLKVNWAQTIAIEYVLKSDINAGRQLAVIGIGSQMLHDSRQDRAKIR